MKSVDCFYKGHPGDSTDDDASLSASYSKATCLYYNPVFHHILVGLSRLIFILSDEYHL